MHASKRRTGKAVSFRNFRRLPLAAAVALAFAPPAWAPTDDIRTSIVKMNVRCNWAQVLEGAIDSAHSSSLHSSDMVPARVLQTGPGALV